VQTCALPISDQDGCGEFFPLSHNIQTMVHPIDEVDVGNPSWTKHDIRSLRSPFRRMARFVLQSHIGLRFDDFTREYTAIDGPNEILSNQRPRNLHRWAIEIDAGKYLALWIGNHHDLPQPVQNGRPTRQQAKETPQAYPLGRTVRRIRSTMSVRAAEW